MEINKAFGVALKTFRNAKNMTQEDFSDISSRTYISSLERGIKGVTLEKIDDLSSHMGIQPLSLLTLVYIEKNRRSSKLKLLNQVNKELSEILGID